MIKIIFQTVKEKIKRIRNFFQGVYERCDSPIDPPYSLDCYALKLVKKHNCTSEKCIPPSEMVDSYTLQCDKLFKGYNSLRFHLDKEVHIVSIRSMNIVQASQAFQASVTESLLSSKEL